MSHGKQHIDALDGLRAIAVLLVMSLHLFGSVVPGGWIGVRVFFVLSGWLITSILVREVERFGSIDLLAFYQRRAVRLMPALILTVILGAVVLVRLDPRPPGWGWDVFAASAYWYDFRIVATPFTSPLAHTWSLAVEEQFYLVWPLILVWIARRRRSFVRPVAVAAGVAIIAAMVGAALSASPLVMAYTPLGNTPELLVGALAAVVGRRWPSSTLGAAVGLLAIGGWGVLVHGYGGGAWQYFGPRLLLAFLTTVVISHVVEYQGSLVARLLSMRPAVWIGQRSYGLYLYHTPLLFLLASEVSLPHHTTKIAVLVSAFVLAALSYRWVEQPLLRRKLQHRSGPTAGVTSEASTVGA